MNLLVTGSTGFLGKHSVKILIIGSNLSVKVAVRCNTCIAPINVMEVVTLDKSTDWKSCLLDQHVVVHSAARAHVIKCDMPLR